ncbi:MAG: hypothetical protein ACO1N7_10090, partial [Sphingobacteriaceae bacterium]
MNFDKKLVISVIASSLFVYTCNTSQNIVKRDTDGKIIIDTTPSPTFLSPKESLKTMFLQKGYRMELVASEPMISEP